MSDRRPEKVKLSAWHRHEGGGVTAREPTAEELLAAVRRLVESGTIEGKEIGVFPTFEGDHVIEIPGQRKKRLADELEPGSYIVVGPVSDGGSET